MASKVEESNATIDEFGYKHARVEGIVYPPFVLENVVKQMQTDVQLRDGDVVIATYPKCGTTWMQQILLALLHGGDKTKASHPMLQAPWLEWIACFNEIDPNNDLCGQPRSIAEINEWDGKTDGEGVPGRRVWKTHACAHLCPWVGGIEAFDARRKCVVVGRNPKDTCCSMYHHTKDGGPAFAYTGDFHHFVEKLFCEGNLESGCFWDWYARWEQAAQKNPNIFFITFEEMKADPVTSVQRLAQFLEVPHDDTVVRNVVGASAFDAMKAKFEENDKLREETGKEVKKNHIRKGGVGTWREELSGDALRILEETDERRRRETGFMVKWDFGDDTENAEDPQKSSKSES